MPVNLERKNTVCSIGTHTFKILKSEEKMGPKGPYWNLQCSCIDKGPDEGVVVYGMVSLADAARWKLDQFLDALNAPREGTATANTFVGKTFKASIKTDTYNGGVKSVFDAFLPATTEVKPADPATQPMLNLTPPPTNGAIGGSNQLRPF